MNRRAIALVAGVIAVALAVLAFLLSGWFLLAAGANASPDTCAQAPLNARRVPAELVGIFAAAATDYKLGPQGAAVLAGLTSIESDFGRNQGPSSAGAVGWTQFMPDTWRAFGVDGDHDGHRDPHNPADAIPAAANYLHHLGAPADWHAALLGYNHSAAYVRDVLARAAAFTTAGPAPAAADVGCSSSPAGLGSIATISGGGGLVEVPGSPGMRVDARILPDVLLLQRRYHFTITAAYSTSSVHAANGEHPIGLALDLVPGPGGSWDDVDRLAHLAEPVQNRPAAPFRWVGYDGDRNHGRGNHLHLSWQHGPTQPGNTPPATWVTTLNGADR